MTDTVCLAWDQTPTPDALEAALLEVESRAVRPRRVEVSLDVWTPGRIRHVLHRRGFRLEGIARSARATASGFVDVLRYARLESDPTTPRDRFTAVMNSVTPRKRLIAHALVLDAEGRVLLCETSFKPDWELPGGIVEPGESPLTGVTREMVEEMGWAPAVTGVLVVDWLRPYLGWEDAVELVFATAVVTAEEAHLLHPDGAEIVGLHWVSPPELDAVMTPFGAARVRSALEAKANGVTAYTEAGVTALG